MVFAKHFLQLFCTKTLPSACHSLEELNAGNPEANFVLFTINLQFSMCNKLLLSKCRATDTIYGSLCGSVRCIMKCYCGVITPFLTIQHLYSQLTYSER